MRSLEIVIRTIAVVAIIVFVSSCASKEAKRIMDTADAVMWTRPDSALAALKSIDTLNLKAKAQRARYSLLTRWRWTGIIEISLICVSSNLLRVIMSATVPMMIG